MKKKGCRSYIQSLVLTFLFCIGITKIAHTHSPLNYHIETFYSQNGLPQNQVSAIVKSKRGILYICTISGVVKFDGQHFTTITSIQKDEKVVYEKLFLNGNQTRLLGKNMGGNAYQIYPKQQLLFNSTDFFNQGSTFYYVFKNGRVSTYNPDTKKSTFVTQLPIRGEIKFVISQQKLYATNGTQSLVLQLKTKRLKYFKSPVQKIMESNGKVIGVVDGKIVDLITERLIPLTREDIQLNDYFFNPNENKHFFATDQGLFEYGINVQKHDISSGFPSNTIRSLCALEDEHLMYVGTGQRGLLKLQLKYTSFEDEKFNKENSLSNILLYNDQLFFAGSKNQIFTLLNGKIKPFFQTKNNISSFNIVDDTLCIGTWGNGLLLYKNKVYLQTIHKLPSQVIHAVFKSKNGIVYIATSAGLAAGKSIQQTKTILKTGQFISFYECRNGNVLSGSNRGVFIFDRFGKKIKHVGKKDGLLGQEVRSFYEDAAGNIWIGTYGGGLYVLREGQLISVNKLPNCFLNPDIFTLAPDGKGNLWMTSNQGLFAVQIDQALDFISGKRAVLLPYFFNANHGIYNPEFNGGFSPNFQFLDSNTICFPSIEGICIFKLKTFSAHPVIGFLDYLLINNRTKTKAKNLRLSAGEHNLKFVFEIPQHNSSRQIMIRYGIQKNNEKIDWETSPKTNVINLNSLSNGKYTIHIQFYDSQNLKNTQTAIYTIEIAPHFYESILFYVLIGLVASLLTIGISFNYLKRKREASEIRNKMEKDFLELRLSAIHARMNPHFIFNTLNGIKYYLSANKEEEAEALVDEFSILLRQVLNYSELNFVTIQQESELISRYLTIEQKRFRNQLSFEIIADPEINQVQIPTMLLLPLVENAINHGILHINHPGRITITFIKHINSIEITVADNGIGIEKSKLINANRIEHNSKGISLLHDKLLNLKQFNSIFTELKINSSNEGTTVTLRINQ